MLIFEVNCHNSSNFPKNGEIVLGKSIDIVIKYLMRIKKEPSNLGMAPFIKIYRVGFFFIRNGYKTSPNPKSPMPRKKVFKSAVPVLITQRE